MLLEQKVREVLSLQVKVRRKAAKRRVGVKKETCHLSEMFLCESRISGLRLFLPHLFTVRLFFILVSVGGEDVNGSISEWSFATPVLHRHTPFQFTSFKRCGPPTVC